jgi:type II secretory pathway pseudopilin PulG
MRSGSGEAGFTYVMALVLVAVLGAGAAAIAETWSHARQREKEAELLWIGNQFRQAIGLYYERSPGTVKRYPEALEDLLEDRRFLSTQRYLRRVYPDPITGKPDWGLVAAPGGGIMGVYSRAENQPVKSGGAALQAMKLTAAARYSDWRFVYVPPVTAVLVK